MSTDGDGRDGRDTQGPVLPGGPAVPSPSIDDAARRAAAGPASRGCSSTTTSSCPPDVGYRGPVACAAAGITYRQLDYWARTGLVEPSVRPATGSGTQRLYGFRDILVLKVVKRLLDTGVSLQQIRQAVQHLRERGVDDLAGITLMSDGASVYECTSPDEVVDLVQGGQGVFGIAVGRVWREVEGSLADAAERAGRRADRAGGRRRAGGPPQDPRHRLSRAAGRPSARRSGAGPRATYAARAGEPARESPRTDGGAEGAILPGTSQAPGPCGRGDSGAAGATRPA